MTAEAAPSTRDGIFKLIKGDPGIHFRGVCQQLGKEIGVVQYHLHVMGKDGAISSVLDGRFTRYYAREDRFSAMEKAVLASWHRPVEREMLVLLATGGIKGSLTRETMARAGVTSQAVTWHVNRMVAAGMLRGDEEPGLCDATRVAITRLQRLGKIQW